MRALAVPAAALLLCACGGSAGPGAATPPASPAATPATQASPTPQGGAATPFPGHAPKQYPSPPPMSVDASRTYTAQITTNLGVVKVDLLVKEAPVAVNNFVFLARDHYFDSTPIHRVVKGFMNQAGDPSGTGRGGPGYTFKDELPPKHPYDPGIVAMANAGPNTNGSQFFICAGASCANLNQVPNYTQFGRVSAGMDVVQAINSVPVRAGAGGEQSSPAVDVHILKVDITEA